VATDPGALSASQRAFLTERHLATLTTLRADGTPHVVPVGFTFDAEKRLVRIITGAGSVKVRNVRAGSRAVVCSVDGRRWLSLEGPASVHDDARAVAAGVAAYTKRYQTPRENPQRVVIHIAVDRVLGRA
jgi:F420H(2)-dependent biliverdin reductase